MTHVNKNFEPTTISSNTISINGTIYNNIGSIKTYKKYGLGYGDFCKLIPELNNSDLSSVKNLDGVVIIDTVLNGYKNIEICENSEILIEIKKSSGQTFYQRAKGCYVVAKSTHIATDHEMLERLIIVTSNVGPFEKSQ